MHLTRHTDYALRLLISLATGDDARQSIGQIAERQQISRTHLMKIANQLVHAGFIEATRGRGGGIRLARDPADINIGAVVGAMEPGCGMIDCTDCHLRRGCSLPQLLNRAKDAFMAELGNASLADIAR